MAQENNIGNASNEGYRSQVRTVMTRNHFGERVWPNPNACSNTEAATTVQNYEHGQAREDLDDFEDYHEISEHILKDF